MSRTIKIIATVLGIVVGIVAVWFLIYTVPDIATKSVRTYFQSIIDGDYQPAWDVIYPGSDFMKQWGGVALSYERFEAELSNARERNTRPTAYHIVEYKTQLDPNLGIEVPVVTVWTENIVSGSPKDSETKDYYLRKDKDGIWKIYKGSSQQK
ncbi:MAG: hypothetical protein HGA95_01495 [Caldiserica bacterium]|nr:hypothetical protein [Caldisericota bacterium]